MRTIVQLSDLHFGTILIEVLHQIAPDLVIVSGDITQRARTVEYEAAQAFAERLPTARLLIPGNHDVPLYDVVRRFVSPLGRYCTHITHDLAPAFIDVEIAVFGINTARSLTFKGGAIDPHQVVEVTAQLATLPATVARIVVTHHPFDIPFGLSGVKIVHGAKAALRAFAPHKVDLYLSGHLHLIHLARALQYVAVFRVEPSVIICETRSWNSATRTFEQTNTQEFLRVSAC